jgi:cytochrome P450
VFDDPKRFDITRTGNRHTAFGLGTFYCLGAALARMEADECFRLLLDRLPGIRSPHQTITRGSNPPLGRRLRSLPVEW